MTPSPALPVALPLLAAAVLAGARPWLRRWMVDLVALLAAAANLGMTLMLLDRSWHGNIVYWFGNSFPRGRMALGIGFEVDPMGAAIAVLASLLTLFALIYSWRAIESGNYLYQPLMLIFLSAMCGFAMTADLFNLFVFFELMSTAAFALCGLKVEESAPLQGAFNFAVTNTVGAFLILTGIALLYAATGALNMAQIGWLLGSRHDSLVVAAGALIISGFLVKAAIAPFHFWLPDAHSVAPTPVCVLFSGLMVELGVFAVLRIATVVFGANIGAAHPALRGTLLVLGSLTVVWGGLMCFTEHHLKRVLAFSTVSHSGAMLLGAALGTPAAVCGWVIYLFAHAMAKAGLFLVAGIVLHRLRTMSEPVLHGRGRPLRFTAILWLLGGLALAGLPPFGLAQGADLMEAAAGPHLLGQWMSFLFLFTGTMTAAAVFRVLLRVFAGIGDAGPSDRASKVDELPESSEKNDRIPARIFIPPAICIALAAVPALIPRAEESALRAADVFLSRDLYIQGIYATAGSPALSMLPHVSLASSLLHGLTAIFCAAILALAAVWHKRIPRSFRWASWLEGRMFPLRELQSGHPGDYVVWCMVGFVVVGGCLFYFK